MEQTYQRLRDIRFQQTYSSGWSGSLNIPFAPLTATTTVQASVSMAQKQRSLPEIVDNYQTFIKRVGREFEIIIAIDEMDKMASDEQAQQFLNEIKTLFGLENCFYLISASESALSSFERRGLPFRDVFDSSFDAIVRVEYLNLQRAQHLLSRRVIGVPAPFLDLCYCMAGGLPRDLIRSFRTLFQIRRTGRSEKNDLSTLGSTLLKEDLQAKLHAVSVEARNVTLEQEVNQLFKMIREIEALLDSNPNLPVLCSELLRTYCALQDMANYRPAESTESSEVLAEREKLALLIIELGTYLYYSVTLIEFFCGDSFDINVLKTAENSDTNDSGRLDGLARARQAFAVNFHIAESIIQDFRKSHDMDIPESSRSLERETQKRYQRISEAGKDEAHKRESKHEENATATVESHLT